MSLFQSNSYFDQGTSPTPDDTVVIRPMADRQPDLRPLIARWSADIDAALNIIADVDTGRKTAGAFGEAVERIDEIRREMDEYGTR